jgi:hypothetical protein
VLDALFSADKPSSSPTRPGSGGSLRRTSSKAGGDPGTSSSKGATQAGTPGQQQGEIKVLSAQKEFNLRIILKKLGVAPRVLARRLNELDSSALDVSISKDGLSRMNHMSGMEQGSVKLMCSQHQGQGHVWWEKYHL